MKADVHIHNILTICSK